MERDGYAVRCDLLFSDGNIATNPLIFQEVLPGYLMLPQPCFPRDLALWIMPPWFGITILP